MDTAARIEDMMVLSKDPHTVELVKQISSNVRCNKDPMKLCAAANRGDVAEVAAILATGSVDINVLIDPPMHVLTL